MKKEILCTAALLLVAVPVRGEYRSKNTHYEAMHVRQMAQRNFTNNGRSRYIYSTQTRHDTSRDDKELGSVDLEEGNRVRDLHIVVDLKAKDRVRSGKRKVTLGRVRGETSQLKKSTITVNSNGKIEF